MLLWQLVWVVASLGVVGLQLVGGVVLPLQLVGSVRFVGLRLVGCLVQPQWLVSSVRFGVLRRVGCLVPRRLVRVVSSVGFVGLRIVGCLVVGSVGLIISLRLVGCLVPPWRLVGDERIVRLQVIGLVRLASWLDVGLF